MGKTGERVADVRATVGRVARHVDGLPVRAPAVEVGRVTPVAGPGNATPATPTVDVVGRPLAGRHPAPGPVAAGTPGDASLTRLPVQVRHTTRRPPSPVPDDDEDVAPRRPP